MDSIPSKQFYTPLELALLSPIKNSLIEKITAPVISFTNSLPFYTPSPFPHFLYNFSDITAEFSDENSISIWLPEKKIITNNNISWSGRFLNVGNQQLIFTGGFTKECTECFTISVRNEEIIKLAPLKIGRVYHCMGWIQGFPAAISGRVGGRVTNSVEILKNNQWIKISPLRLARICATSVNTQNAVWVVGGRDQSNLLIDSIEKYEREIWVFLSIKLPSPRALVGLCNMENNILLIGGLTSSPECINTVLKMDIRLENTITKAVELKSLSSFCSNQFEIDDRMIYCCNVEGSLLNLEINSFRI